ncbi:hypothetical protein [Nitrospirillum iridis]|uniref:Uncharacterized protein n=1 Tax=Nitrospirillum iridis TaxID=765888 RepID=A0A7X0B2E0_9PROT|nr:hypothetical protein [Nitrospirillum iridis]MBB6254102.1 hypothetical protein [Nitrospirillum iridis]
MTKTKRTRAGNSTIDRHPQRTEIEAALVRGVPYTTIAARYDVSKDAVCRHNKKLPPERKAAVLAEKLKPGADLEAIKREESEGILLRLRDQRLKLLTAQDVAITSTQLGNVAALSAQIHRNEQLVAEYLGLLHKHSSATITAISLVMTPEYARLRAALTRALRPFPEAAAAVAAAIRDIENAAPPMIEGSASHAA